MFHNIDSIEEFTKIATRVAQWAHWNAGPVRISRTQSEKFKKITVREFWSTRTGRDTVYGQAELPLIRYTETHREYFDMSEMTKDVLEYMDTHKEEVTQLIKRKLSEGSLKLTEVGLKSFRAQGVDVDKKTAIRFEDALTCVVVSYTEHPDWNIAHYANYFVVYDSSYEAAIREVGLADKLELAMDNITPNTFMNAIIPTVNEAGEVGTLQIARIRDNGFEFFTFTHQLLCAQISDDLRATMLAWVQEILKNNVSKPGRLKRISQKHFVTYIAKAPEKFVTNPHLKDIATILLTDPDCVPEYLARVEKAYQKLLKSK